MCMKTYYLYHLIDPNTNLVRYVGITCRPKQRYKEHVNSAKKLRNHKANWINTLTQNTQKPIFKIVAESQDKEEIIKYEIQSILEIQNLTNSTTGGEYFTFTTDVIIKLRERNKGSNNPCYQRIWTDEEKQNLSIVHQGEKHSDDWNKNIGLGAHRKEVIINGITYTSIKDVMRKLNVGFKKAQSFVTK